MDLAEILVKAIEHNRALINETGQRWSDRPIQIELSWHPQMGKLDMVMRTVHHLPSFRSGRPDEG